MKIASVVAIIKKKPWMFSYAVIFLALSVSFVANNIENHYHVLYVAWSVLAYVLANAGNAFYLFEYPNNKMKNIWRIVAPIVVLDFIAAGIIDMTFIMKSQEVPLAANIFIWIIGLVIFFPTFRANFIFGYKK